MTPCRKLLTGPLSYSRGKYSWNWWVHWTWSTKHHNQYFSSLTDLPTYRIVGDNCDLHQKASRQSLSRRDQAHHWFNMYGVHDRVLGLHLSDVQPIAVIATLPAATFLPSVDDCVAIRKEFIILVTRVLLQYCKWFECLKPVVPSHIAHEYTEVMTNKSTIVS